MEKKTYKVNNNTTNPDKPSLDEAPIDPSNTSNIGQKVEQGIIDIKEGISEQSSEWEDNQERNMPLEENTAIDSKGENYLKSPSPEEKSLK